MSNDIEAGNHYEHEDERLLIQRYSELLANGTVPGPRTITRLVELTGLKRWKITLRHVDLKIAFQESIGKSGQKTADTDALEKKLEHEMAKGRALREENSRLQAILERYVVVISELTADLHLSRQDGTARSNVTRFVRPHL